MADTLYPVFDIPADDEDEEDVEQRFLPTPLFDFESGDFVRDGSNRIVMVDGRDAFILWVLKILSTQEGACLSYLEQGVDIEGCMAEENRPAIESALERSITEALMVHPCTERVYEFDFEWDTDSVRVSFIVKPKAWPAFDAQMNVV
ncbi:MAG: DUF2634 domain-containing protein [Oscillospiraceae bacterium]|nr:DUF2634 domain-containing protein [Oscillospiraceae bacterium]